MHELLENPRLARRTRQSPHQYFRLTTRTFADGVCVRFADELDQLPTVDIHGDAHVEQFAAFRGGRALWDVEHATSGPAVLDLVRFATSLRLAALERGWRTSSEELVQAFIDAYHEKQLNGHSEPTWARRVTSSSRETPMAFLENAESLMLPASAEEQAALSQWFSGRYSPWVLQSSLDITTSMLVLKSVGRVDIGVGSALEPRFLFRVEGLSRASEDDIILEAKPVVSLAGVRCISSDPGGRASPARVGMRIARLGASPYVAQVPSGARELFGADPVWVHQWFSDYRELAISELVSAVELKEIAVDGGYYLRRIHLPDVQDPIRDSARLREKIIRTATEMERATLVGWCDFRSRTGASEPHPLCRGAR